METFFCNVNILYVPESSEEENEDIEIEYQFKCDELLQSIRKVIRKIKKSPAKNSFFQEFVKKNLGTELEFKLDCRTRWNSTVEMIKRFIKLYPSLKEANCVELSFSDNDLETLEVFFIFNLFTL